LSRGTSMLGVDLAISDVLLKRLGLSRSFCAIVSVGIVTSIVATVMA
jgi:hypothetical protein